MRRKMLFTVVCGLLASAGIADGGEAPTAAGRYDAEWKSLDSRPTPRWWTDAKFGIFVHWGPYAVPAFAPTDEKSVSECYAEQYWGKLIAGRPAFCRHHAEKYGTMPYGNFAASFTAENFDAAAWARLFRKAGAKYAVLTSKHHDGYALWPSPESPYWNSAAIGPGRDLCGEFADAMRGEGLRCGFYFSLLEYGNPLYPGNWLRNPAVRPMAMKDWARRVNLPQMKELAEKYLADVIWPDGEWDHPDGDQLSTEFLAWLYNESSVRDTVVVNDRWGKGCRGRHGGHFTTEYGSVDGSDGGIGDVRHPWEECRGMGRSFGFNRFETAEDYMSAEACLELLVSTVSRGGNLLLNVGPTADGRIPAVMQDRLLDMGRWLEVNGEAIYGTGRWSGGKRSEGESRVYCTAKGDAVYVIAFGNRPARRRIGIGCAVRGVTVLGFPGEVRWSLSDGTLTVDVPDSAARAAIGPCVIKVECETDSAVKRGET